MKNYKKLKIWQKGMDIVAKTYKLAAQSLGSAYELETQVLIMDMLEFGDKAVRSSLLGILDEEQKMLQSFIQKIGE
jgi:hypothetical protein